MFCRMMLPILLLLATGAHAEQDWDDPWRDVFVFQSKLAKQGNAQAQFKLGEMYEEGRGVSADLHQARYWYEKAAGQGVEEALDRIDALGKSTQSAEQAETREAERQAKLQQEEAARRAAEQEATRQATEQARLEAERKAQAQRRAQEQAKRQEAKRREEARRREQERQAALAAQRAREEAALREQARDQALLVGEPQTPTQDTPAPEAEAEQQAEPGEATTQDKTRFRTNPCEGPAARFTSTCR